MQDLPNITVSSATLATLKVGIQKRVVLAMLEGDPGRAYACALLRQMEQSAAMAVMNLAFYEYNKQVENILRDRHVDGDDSRPIT